MLEIKIQLSATDELIAAMRNLATAFADDGKTPDPTANVINYPTIGSQPVTEKVTAAAAPKQADVPLTPRATSTVGTTAPVNTVPINAPINPTTAQGTQPTATPTAPVNPTPAPVATPAQAPGAPLSATPAQMATPIAPTAPVATPAPAVTPVANVAPAPAVPTSAPQYTLDMIATAGSALIDAGKMDQLMQLLGKFGVASLTELAPESYGAVANELRAMGAAI